MLDCACMGSFSSDADGQVEEYLLPLLADSGRGGQPAKAFSAGHRFFSVYHLRRRSLLSPRQAVLTDLLSRWPLVQQLRTGADGTGPESYSQRTKELKPKHHGATATPSICPYCGVGW